jgi:hypothetical protein
MLVFNGGKMQDNNSNPTQKKDYVFGGIQEYDLEKIEEEVLKESVYLDVFAGSDIGFKENCTKLNSSEIFNKMSQLNSYSFNYKSTEFPEYNFANGLQFGVMAQELETVFPELIKVDEAGKKLVNYTQLIPLMLETIKHLSERVASLESKIN